MLDLMPIETRLKQSGKYPTVDGALALKKALETGANSNAAFVTPLTTQSQKTSSGTLTEYMQKQRFAVVLALRSPGKADANSALATMVNDALNLLVGHALAHTLAIELGPGGLLPSKNSNSTVFWQQEFLVSHTFTPEIQ